MTIALMSAAVVWIVSPVLALLYLTQRSSALELSPVQPVWAQVEINEGVTYRDIGLALSWTPATPILAPAWDGLVQMNYVGVGDMVVSGTPITRISGIDRLAFESAVPFSRTLQVGDTGGEVAALHVLLKERGLPTPAVDTFTTLTAQSVAKFAKSIGADPRSETFDPAWVVWLPRPITVSSVLTVEGAPALTAGLPIVEGSKILQSADLIDVTFVDAIAQMEMFDPQLDLMESMRIRATDSDKLLVGTTEIQLDPETLSPSQAGLDSLRPLIQSDARVVSGRLEVLASEGQWVVPAAAIFASTAGDLCVLTRGSGPQMAERVEIASSVNGRAVVTGNLSSSAEVALAPPVESRRCDS